MQKFLCEVDEQRFKELKSIIPRVMLEDLAEIAIKGKRIPAVDRLETFLEEDGSTAITVAECGGQSCVGGNREKTNKRTRWD
jgi:hypothetical protein